MAELTRAQRDVLEALAEAEGWWRANEIGPRGIANTLRGLVRLNLVEIGYRWEMEDEYRITPAGRKALEADHA